MNNSLVGKTSKELSELVASLGEPEYKGKQLSKWVYQRMVRNIDEMTDLSKNLRQKLGEVSEVGMGELVKKSESEDQTVKYLIKFNDEKSVECVNIFQPDHLTACISTQVGCNVKCPFCATGLMGFKRNLKAGEIVEQYLLMQKESEQRISRVVYMGMGEPFLNYDETMKSVMILNKEIGLGMRNITISTSGILKNMERLMNENLQLNLAVSLHSADDEQRDRLVPINKNNPLPELLKLCKKYAEFTKRRITFEYVMLKDINDSVESAELLVRKLKGIHCHINLIPHNPIYSAEKIEATSLAKIKQFQRILTDSGFPATIRASRGASKDSACGQLSVREGE